MQNWLAVESGVEQMCSRQRGEGWVGGREMIGDKPDADDSLTVADNAILCHGTNVYDERNARLSAIRPVEPRRAAGWWGGGFGGWDYVDEEKRPLRS